jgi:uncharacterized protein (TIGR03437 family)
MLMIGAAGTAHATTLTAASTAVTITYTQPATPGAAVTDALTASTANTFFNVVTSTVPGWLTVTQTGTAGTGLTGSALGSASFQANASASTMEPGTYTASVQFNSAMTTNPTIVVTLAIKAAPAKFSAVPTAANPATQVWTPGSSTGITVDIVCSSNGEPVSFTVALGGAIGAASTASPMSGIAYSWGTTVVVNVPLSYLLPTQVGTPLAGTVTLTPNNGAAAIVIPLNINVNLPNPTITSYSVSELPVDLAADHNIVVTGTGFQAGTTQVQARVHTGGYALVPPDHYVITGPTSMILTLDHSLYLRAAQLLDIQVSNATPASWLPVAPIALNTVTTPIIYAVTNAASFSEPAAGANPVVSPYEIISIFGANFDTANGLANNTSYVAQPEIFGTTLNNSKGQAVMIYFCLGNKAATNCTGGTGADLLAQAPIVFVSNTQINAVVPVEIEGASNADIGGNSGTTGANVLVSVAGTTNDVGNQFLLDTAVSTPGVFTPGGTGRGAAAVLNHDWTLNTAANPNPKGQVFHIYLTGLGDPPSTGADTAAVTLSVPSTCVSTANYLALLAGASTGPTTAAGNSAGGTAITGSSSSIVTVDGAIMELNNLWAGVLPPCFPVATSSGVQVKLGTNTTAIVPTYAGFVGDSIAGLYQIDATVPATGYTYAPAIPNGGGPITLTVLVNSVPSQTGVTFYTN